MSNAPYCPISRSQPTEAHRRLPRLKPDAAAIPPPVHNLLSVINALNIMNNIVQTLTIGAPQINNIYPEPPEPPPPPPQYVPTRWEEVDRGYIQQKVINPDDDTQVVPIKIVSSVTWTESGTGHSLVYKG